MKELPILFSAAMVRAILEGRKTQTRRVVKDSAWCDFGDCDTDGRTVSAWGIDVALCPYGKSGDRLWVREAFRAPNSLDDLSPKKIGEACLNAGYRQPWCPLQFEADGARTSEKDWREFGSHPSTAIPGRYRHARFMPRWAARITLEVTDVRVQRLQKIGNVDAEAEGCGGGHGIAGCGYSATPYEHFKHLWESISGAGAWDANPWVWAITFRRVETTTHG